MKRVCLIAASAPAEVVAAEVVVAEAPAVRTEVRYYAIIFAYQDAVARPQKTHTFATFVKLSLEDRPGRAAGRRAAFDQLAALQLREHLPPDHPAERR